MQDHQMHAHEGEQPPKFAFKVIKKCKSSLERQVREAVRIQMRGNVLNKQGTYNRCKLTRLVVDEEWERKKWSEAWAPRVIEVDESGIRADSAKGKKKGEDIPKSKGRKVENEEGEAWGRHSQLLRRAGHSSYTVTQSRDQEPVASPRSSL